MCLILVCSSDRNFVIVSHFRICGNLDCGIMAAASIRLTCTIWFSCLYFLLLTIASLRQRKPVCFVNNSREPRSGISRRYCAHIYVCTCTYSAQDSKTKPVPSSALPSQTQHLLIYRIHYSIANVLSSQPYVRFSLREYSRRRAPSRLPRWG